MASSQLSSRQRAALARHDRMSDLARAATVQPTQEDMAHLQAELQRARDATAELAEKYQHLQIAFCKVRDLKLCPECSQPATKQVSA